MVAVVPPDAVDAVAQMLSGRGVPTVVLGEVRAGTGLAELTGSHPA